MNHDTIAAFVISVVAVILLTYFMVINPLILKRLEKLEDQEYERIMENHRRLRK